MNNELNQLVGFWVSPGGTLQVNADGTAILDGQTLRYTADGQILTLTGMQGSLQFLYRLDGDTMTYVLNGQTITANRLSKVALADLVQAMQRGAGVWVGTESSLDPSLYVSWTQYVVLNPDGSVDYGRSDWGAQVTAYNQLFLNSLGTNLFQTHSGRWQSNGMNIIVQWNNGLIWQGQADLERGQLVFFGIGSLNPGTNVIFERQPIPFSIQRPAYTESVNKELTNASQSPNANDLGNVQPSAGSEATLSNLLASLKELQTSGRLDPAIDSQIAALINDPQQFAALVNDPQHFNELSQQLIDAGATEIGSGAPLEIADFYREGPGKYNLRWSLSASIALPIPFDQLDRKTQFFVLFNAWTQRELEGMVALNGGQVDVAEQIFHECLERADQIDVSELRARSYEGLMRVAQTRGDPQMERKWIQAAQQARAG